MSNRAAAVRSLYVYSVLPSIERTGSAKTGKLEDNDNGACQGGVKSLAEHERSKQVYFAEMYGECAGASQVAAHQLPQRPVDDVPGKHLQSLVYSCEVLQPASTLLSASLPPSRSLPAVPLEPWRVVDARYSMTRYSGGALFMPSIGTVLPGARLCPATSRHIQILRASEVTLHHPTFPRTSTSPGRAKPWNNFLSSLLLISHLASSLRSWVIAGIFFAKGVTRKEKKARSLDRRKKQNNIRRKKGRGQGRNDRRDKQQRRTKVEFLLPYPARARTRLCLFKVKGVYVPPATVRLSSFSCLLALHRQLQLHPQLRPLCSLIYLAPSISISSFAWPFPPPSLPHTPGTPPVSYIDHLSTGIPQVTGCCSLPHIPPPSLRSGPTLPFPLLFRVTSLSTVLRVR
ncbi:hypothetical protein TESG_07517 [Trichophyton tonsurans CBS 112818]|uniref:Uncharacterized protein n=1 Tax=Trichophyton tonsurans (strain CBS 112818) TaxID=647933 RepID=F2S9E8_TRIT1|nr:hypothetical protein TESG_07517 [Trichophyton tonsurans CBS 112818]